MKIILFLLFPTLLFSQEIVDRFHITPTGINQAVIIEIPGSADSLFIKTKNWINHTFKNPADVMPRAVENEMLGGQMIFSDGLVVNNGGVKVYFDIDLSYQINFKDDKIKFDIYNVSFPPQFKPGSAQSAYNYTGGFLEWSFYNKKGDVRKRAIPDIAMVEAELNGLVEDLRSFLTSPPHTGW